MNVISTLLFAVMQKLVFLSIRSRLLPLNLCTVILLLSRISLPHKLLLLMLLKRLTYCRLGFVSVFLIIRLKCWRFLRMNLTERRPLNLDSFRNQVISLVLSLLPQLFSQYLESKNKKNSETEVKK